MRLRCAFQKLDGEVTREGLWLNSTVPGAAASRFRVVADRVGREGAKWSAGIFAGVEIGQPTISPTKMSALQSVVGAASALPRAGQVEVVSPVARFTRPGLTEEYSVSVDGVRQDFVVAAPPAGAGELWVELALTGAQAEAAADGAQLVLDSGRRLAYSRLRVVDATGKELAARMEVIPVGDEVTSVRLRGQSSERANEQSALTSAPTSMTRLAVVVNDTDAVYPVRIDPTFTDANWSAILPRLNNGINALAVDGSGNLYAGGTFTGIFDGAAHTLDFIAKWNGSAWSALGAGLSDPVYTVAVSGTDVYVGGVFTTTHGGAPSALPYLAKWNGSTWSAVGGRG